jgi:hypothetical protein
MKGFIEITDRDCYKHLINISRIESVCEGDDNELTRIFSLGESTSSYYANQSYEEIKRLIEEAQHD